VSVTRAYKMDIFGEPVVCAQIVRRGWVVWTKFYPPEVPLRTARMWANIRRATYYGRYQ
jgi:hypothetical protein